MLWAVLQSFWPASRSASCRQWRSFFSTPVIVFVSSFWLVSRSMLEMWVSRTCSTRRIITNRQNSLQTLIGKQREKVKQSIRTNADSVIITDFITEKISSIWIQILSLKVFKYCSNAKLLTQESLRLSIRDANSLMLFGVILALKNLTKPGTLTN
jgi:hypothetical protein